MPVIKVMVLEALANKLRAKNNLHIAWSVVQQAYQDLENTQAMLGNPADIAYAHAALALAIVDKDLARTAYQNTALIYQALVTKQQTDKEEYANVDLN